MTVTKEESMSEFKIESDNLQADCEMRISITHLPANTQICIKATVSDYYCVNASMELDHNVEWSAQATFLSDGNGSISLEKDPALFGSYTGVCPMGLFFRLKPVHPCKKALADCFEEVPYFESYRVCLQAFEQTRCLAETEFKRYYQPPTVKGEVVYGLGFQGRLFFGEGCVNAPAIIVVSGSEGRIEKAQNIAQLLSGYGFVTLAVCYFGMQGVSKFLERIPLEIVEEAISVLKKRKEVNPDRIGIYGRSKGAEFALLSASRFPDLKCVVANSPSAWVMEGIKKWKPSKSSSWTEHAKEVPYTQFSMMNYLKEKIINRKTEYRSEESIIPVEQINGSVLVLAAYNDEIWPAFSSAVSISERLRLSGFAFPYHKYIYSNSGHMMTVAFQPNSRYPKVPWQSVMKESEHSWKKTVAFFKEKL
ncbi:acyl-CoA thioesterase/bile acid-CoA:amino acid N-acyltransferase family protein [Faecalispora jeddahensis]|uniref:acyl-CoA thioesterase/bile acid-CoA:amino acid N-acyltransferase family protein n=1 Tax=Faecalispora jeddahensis TaxID=1414721 RepID=UPI002DD69303|nr:acyl-CoA thioesterase/bile acid-CoA:amino acid N-acyltransferase family protein [Faecalispora jeddahensis]